MSVVGLKDQGWALSSISLYEKLIDQSWRSLIGNTFWLPLKHQEKQEKSNSKEQQIIIYDAKKNVKHILILSGDYLYRMDYMDFV
ncbi:hypothetical protein RHGRI_021223 [Rhododendron griersonianum]|uniref:Uncharacterized protein n=1 Tax=Rhododendron griersonianum TaxID=479676 RepID=A0AAV6JMQ8_9ERIC|nr:hypothetical protein RHGRI_021223 [Rhododendron griersonianum]KAG5541315.1 hypothetical protein RHGRI_021223 [Rhododendron griersonianum]